MTHDELLAKINKGGTEAFESDSCGWLALSAVLELHKPEWVLLQIVLKGTKPDPVAICSHCSDEQWRKSYPCPTIQAIEKELG
jgi:hypothetical protein